MMDIESESVAPERTLGVSDLIRAADESLIATEKYQVHLPQWTGPYDVLLQVIEDQNLNLLDLDISVLLEHYLSTIEGATHIDVDEAGEFLVVAATLAQIKSKLLLPKDEQPEEEKERDPREDLVRYLMEYQKIKQAAALLGDRPLLGRDVFVKGNRELFEGIETDGQGTLFQLVKGFQKAMREFRAEIPMDIVREEVSVSERLHDIFQALRDQKQIEFNGVLRGGLSKVYIIISFLACLELVRLKKVKLFQADSESPLYLQFMDGATEDDMVSSEFDTQPEGADSFEAAPQSSVGESI